MYIVIFLLSLILFAFSQQITYQTKRQNQNNLDISNDRMNCTQLNQEVVQICSLCKANHAYNLDEQNWLIIGVFHQFGKEYKVFVQKLFSIFNGTFFAAFNKNFICFNILNSISDVNGIFQNLYYIQSIPQQFFKISFINISYCQIVVQYREIYDELKIIKFKLQGEVGNPDYQNYSSIQIENDEIFIDSKHMLQLKGEDINLETITKQDKTNKQQQLLMTFKGQNIFKEFVENNFQNYTILQTLEFQTDQIIQTKVTKIFNNQSRKFSLKINKLK